MLHAPILAVDPSTDFISEHEEEEGKGVSEFECGQHVFISNLEP
jgi:hypothetical protein